MYNELRGKIVEAGLTQKSVAEKIGISEHALGNKLNGKRDFKGTVKRDYLFNS